ncbi:unnamed protein product, partial [Closterium sp. Naga37s-1]
VFLCYGRFIFGPDFRSLVISFLLILIPGILFCVFVAAQLPGKIPGGIVVLPVAICYLAWNLFILVFTACRDPGIVPRNLVPPDPDPDMLEAMRVEGGGLARGGRFSPPRTKDMEINGFRVKVKYCDTCLLYRWVCVCIAIQVRAWDGCVHGMGACMGWVRAWDGCVGPQTDPPAARTAACATTVWNDPPAARTAACAITWAGKVREEREGQCIGKVREEREGQCIGKVREEREGQCIGKVREEREGQCIGPLPSQSVSPYSFSPNTTPPHTPPFSPYQRNYRFFYMFTTTTTLLCLFVFAISTLLIALLVNNTYEPGGQPRTLWEAMGKAPVAVILMVYTFIVVWFVGGLTAFHTFLSATNQVSIVC